LKFTSSHKNPFRLLKLHKQARMFPPGHLHAGDGSPSSSGHFQPQSSVQRFDC
jgi:hypothetical protein